MPLDPAAAFAALTPAEQAAVLAGAHPNQPTVPDPAPAEATPAPEDDDLVELADFYDDELELKHRDRDGVVHVYRLPAADAQTGLLCQRMFNTGMGVAAGYHVEQRAVALQESSEQTLDDDTEEHLYRRLLGGDTSSPRYSPARDVWKQLQDEGAPWPLMRHVGVTALLWAGRDRETAKTYWLDGARRPKAPSESTPPTPRQPRDRQAKTSEGTASTTRRRASTSSTTPRKKTTAPKGTRGAKS